MRKFIFALKIFLGLPPFWLRILFLPRPNLLVFNHTTRVRRIGNRVISTYCHAMYEVARNENILVVEERIPEFEHDSGRSLVSPNMLYSFIEALGQKLVLSKSCVKIFLFQCFFGFVWWPLLIIKRPKRIVFFVWYGKPFTIFGFRSVGIEVWDQQHGLLYKEHPYYSLDNIRKEQLPELCLPEKFGLYGEYWMKDMEKAGWDGARCKVIGYPNQYQITARPEIKDNYVLYIPQPGSWNPLLEHLERHLDVYREQGFVVVISVHPHVAEDMARYEKYGASVVVSKYDTYSLVKFAVCTITASSTFLWESLLFGKKAFVLETNSVQKIGIISDGISSGLFNLLKKDEFPALVDVSTSLDICLDMFETFDSSHYHGD